jgi:hypothetical protein
MMGPDNIRSQQRNPKSFLLDYNVSFFLLLDLDSQLSSSSSSITLVPASLGLV